MFSISYQEDNTYKVHFPDDSHIILAKGVEDTPELRRELACLSHRIAADEYIKSSEGYVDLLHAQEFTLEELENLLKLYIDIREEDEVWAIKDSYAEPAHETISQLRRGKLLEKNLLKDMIKLRELQNESTCKENQ